MNCYISSVWGKLNGVEEIYILRGQITELVNDFRRRDLAKKSACVIGCSKKWKKSGFFSTKC
jgi:hypothetical protein